MNDIILEGKEFTDKNRFHEIVKAKLNLPEYYGRNLDALWDCFTGDIGLPVTIIWNDFDYSKKYLGDYAQKALEMFCKAECMSEGKLTIKLIH